MANNNKENKIKKFTKEAIGKTLNQFNKEIGIADLVEINKNQDRILNGILSQVNDENTEKTEKSNIITLDNSTDGIVELKEIQGDTNVNVSKIEEMPITHDIGDKEGNVFTLNEIPKGAISIGEIQGNTMVNCNKDDKKELVLMKDLSTQGDNNITLTEGVDGGLVDVALEGNTMVNVCDQKDPVAITKSYTVETGNHVALQGEYDGKCRPVVTGNTLVNLVPRAYSSRTFTAPIKRNMHFYDKDQTGCLFKPSTTYTYIVEVLELSFDSGAVEIQWGNTYSKKDETIWNNKNVAEYTSTGIYRFTLTTKSSFETTYKENRCYVSTNSATSGNFSFRLTILEGDYTNKPIPEYFEGLQSSFEDKVVTQEMIDAGKELAESLGKYKVEYKVTGKNKLNPVDIVYGYVNTRLFIDNNSISYIMKCEPNTTYTVQATNNNEKRIGLFTDYPVNQAFTTRTLWNNDCTTFTTNSNEHWLVFYVLNRKELGVVCNIQIEEGTVATSYEPYKESTKTLYLNSPLLEGDTIEEKDGGIYHVHRWNQVVLDSSLSPNSYIIKSESITNNDRKTLWIIMNKNVFSNRAYKFISDKFINASWNKDIQGMSFRNNVDVMIEKSKLISLDKTGVNDYFSKNPASVVYEISSPQYELIEQSNLAIPSYTNGHLDLASAVPVSKVNFLHFEEELTYLYPSTSYTVQFISDGAITVYITLGGTSLLSQSIVAGLNRIAITTPDTLVDNKLIIDGVGAKISKVVVTDTNREFMYFEGMKSVGEGNGIEILSHNGNLYKRLENSYYKIYGSSVVVVEDNEDSFIFEVNDWDKGISYLISTEGLFKNKKYKLTWEKYNELAVPQLHASGITLLNSNKRVKEQISFEKISNTDWNFELPDSFEQGDILEIRFKTSVASGQNGACNICINEMGVAKNTALSKLNTQRLTHEPLRAVGDIKDKYVLIDGKWYIERNCGEMVLDGSGNYLLSSNSENPNGIPYFNFYGMNDGKPSSLVICDKLIGRKDTTEDKISVITTNLGLMLDGNRVLRIRQGSTTLDEFKTWITNNSLTAVYQLATPTYEPIDYNPFEVYSDTTHISNNSTIPCNMTIKNTGFNCLLKPSTTYTVSSSRGINTVTTGADIGDSCLRFYNEDTSTKTTMKDVLVLEGDWTTKADLIPANFSGIESCFEQELVTDENDEHFGMYRVNAKVVGKNRVNNIKVGYVSNKGTLTNDTRNCMSDFIAVNPNTKYVASIYSTDDVEWVGNKNYSWFDKDKNFIKRDVVSNNCSTSPTTARYLIVHNGTKNGAICDINKVCLQLEQGDTATPYEPYKENYIEFYIDEPLRGIGDVKDKVYVKDDKVVVERKCGSYTFDGSESSWRKYSISSSLPPATSFIVDINNIPMKGDIIGANHNVISLDDMYYGKCGICTGKSYSDRIYISIDTRILNTQDVNIFKQWLQQNPLSVVYQLAEPVYEEVEYSSNRLILNTFNNESFNNSTLFLDTTILPKLSFKPLYEELVYVKNSTKYYIQFNAVGSGEVVINLGGTELTTEIAEGYNCIPITTPSESTNLMTIIGQGITISEVVVSEVVCGGYYKGLQSCFEEHMENGKYRVLLRGIALDGSKVNGIKLYINEPLRGVENAKDRLCIKDGKLMVERKCGEIVLDGSNDENWGMQNNINYLLTLAGAKRIYLKNSGVGISDKLIVKKSSSTEGVYIYPILQDSVDYIRIANGVSKWSDKESFKQWLQQNPITIVYQLAEPIYEEATNEYGLPIVFEGYENGIVYIDSAVTPTTHIKYTSNNQLATTLSEAEEQNIATQEDINMNVVTYMMDIDMILTEMEMSNDTSVMAVRRDSSNENMLDRMSKEDKKVYQDNTVVMLEKMITANVLEKEDIEGRINMYYNKNRISKEQYEYLKSLL